MGADAFINIERPSSVKPNAGKTRRITYDLPLAVVVIALCSFGLLMVYSASWDFSFVINDGDAAFMFNRQVLWLVLGTTLALLLARIDYRFWRRLVVPIMIVTILMLAVVLVVNEVRLGASRTVVEGSIQPSELAKLITVIYLAVWMYSHREHLHDINLGLLPLAIILGTIGGLIFLQPDLSATATILLLGGLLFFIAGGDLKQIGILLIVAIVVGWIIAQLSTTGRTRLEEYWSGMQDPTQASYHMRRSFEAIVKGGWFGVGLGRATTKVTGLPVPPTDSIFAVVVEEFGMLGGAMVVALYGALIWRGLRIAQKAPDMLGTLLAAGLTFWLGSEALLNMMVMVGLMPFAGNALPFISAGGSNLTASLAAVGILMNISRQSGPKEPAEEEWRNFNATIDLRRRNGRRGISRSRRTPVIER